MSIKSPSLDEMLNRPISSASLEIALRGPIDERFSDSIFPPQSTAYFPIAQIATSLFPLVNKYVDSTTHVRITGYDGPSFSAKSYPWTSYLENWLERGVSVEYFLQNPTAEALEIIRGLSRRHGKGSFQAFVLDAKAELTSDEKRRLSAWKTFHFALFSNPELVWVENYHPPGTTEARECRYLDARDQSSPLYLELEHRWKASRDRFFCPLWVSYILIVIGLWTGSGSA